MKITLTINNITKLYDVTSDTSLLELLRKEKITSAKDGCGSGHCGACTVLLDNKAVPSCLIPVASIRDSNIITLEQFSTTDEYKDIKEGLSKAGILLCGYCNAAKYFLIEDILSKNIRPQKEEIIKQCSYAKCKCTETDALVNAVIYSSNIRRKRKGVLQNGERS